MQVMQVRTSRNHRFNVEPCSRLLFQPEGFNLGRSRRWRDGRE